jgi:hypothetical protein
VLAQVQDNGGVAGQRSVSILQIDAAGHSKVTEESELAWATGMTKGEDEVFPASGE